MSNSIFYPPPQPMIGGHQPLDRDRKRAATNHIPGDEPPRRHPMRSAAMMMAVLSIAWAPNTFSLETLEPMVWVNRVDDPPRIATQLANQYNIRAQWEPEQPAQPPKVYFAGEAAPPAANDPPFGLPQQWLNHVVSTWRDPDPQPWFGYKLNPAFEHVQIDEPPYSHSLRVSSPALSTLLSQWWEPQGLLKIEQSIGLPIVDDPPFSQRDPLPTILQLWEPPAPQPQRQLPKQVQSVDNPPLGLTPQNNRIVLEAWTPPDPQPQRSGPLPVAVTSIVGDSPPIGKRPQISFNEPDWPAQTGAKIAPLIEVAAVQEKVPFVNLWSAIVNQWWQLIDVPPQRAGPLPIAVTSVRGDEPPRTRGPQTYQDEPTWLAQRSAQIAPLIPAPAAPADDPPFARRRVDSIVDAWQPGSFTIDVIEGLVVQTPGDNPPIRHDEPIWRTIREAWEPSHVAPPRPKNYPQAIPPQVDNPPIRARSSFPLIWDQWHDPVTVIEIPREPIDPQANPPFSHKARLQLSVILDAWQERIPALPQQRKYIQPSTGDQPPRYRPFQGHAEPITWDTQTRPKYVPEQVQAVNDPPFGYRPYRGDTTPVEWGAQDTRKLIQPSTGDNPPLGYRPFQGHQAELTWNTQETRKYPIQPEVVVTDPPFGYRPFRGDMTPESWPTQETRKLVQPSTGDQPPRYRPFQGYHSEPTWDAQDTRKYPQIPVNDPPFGYRPFRGDTTPESWPAQSAGKLVQPSTGDEPPRFRPFQGYAEYQDWRAQSRVQLPQGAPAVVNDPPFPGPAPWLYRAIEAWQPPYFPPPRLTGPLTESGPVVEQQEFRKLITLREDRIDVIKG